MSTLFFAQYIRHFRMVGAVAPSSRFLARRMLRAIDFARAETIVEYGPGTGVFTAALLARRRPATRLIIIEQNDAFYELLSRRFGNYPNLTIVHDSAENISTILAKLGVQRVEYVVSGLPFAALPAAVSHRILQRTTKLLGDHGTFITFQYTLLKKNFLQEFFPKIAVSREYANLPPAYVLTCSR